MSETELSAGRCRGRPQMRSDAETRAVIVAAAAQEFLASGYATTSMDAVAKCAGVSKKTLYRLIPNKAELLRLFIARRIERFMLAIDDGTLRGLDAPAALERIMTAFGLLTLSEETIALNRLIIAECDRFPELAATFYTEAILATSHAVEHYLRLQRDAGVLDLEDPQAAADMLRGMMIMEPQRAVMLGRKPAPSEAEIAARARACVHLFLRGCLKAPVAAPGAKAARQPG